MIDPGVDFNTVRAFATALLIGAFFDVAASAADLRSLALWATRQRVGWEPARA
jgi:hypothetical protein